MKLYEFEGKLLFKRYGIPVPKGAIINDHTEVQEIIKDLGLPVVLKSQVLAGGRGKSGGVVVVNSYEEAQYYTKKLFNLEIQGEKPRAILVEEKLNIDKEFYMSITVDRTTGKLLIIFSPEGGVDIEELSKMHPEKITKAHINLLDTFQPFKAREIIKSAGIHGRLNVKLSEVLWRLYLLTIENDVILAEINPLVITKDAQIFAADSKVIIDDNALFRSNIVKEVMVFSPEERIQDPLEREAAKYGISYVRLDGWVGTIAGGAGLALTTIDLLKMYGLPPANFLDTGGGITSERMEKALDIVLRTPNVKCVFINVYGGINNCKEMAIGIVNALKKHNFPRIPILVKMRGHYQEEGWALLEKYDVYVFKDVDTEAAIKELLKLLSEGGE